MLKVAVVVEDFSIGGAQRVVSEIVKNIDQHEAQLLVLCLENRKDTEMALAVERVATVKYLNIKGKNLIKNYHKVSTELNRFEPDVVHAHLVGQLYSVPWGLIHNIPVIITAHTKPEKAFIKKIERLIRFGVKRKKIYIVSVSKGNLEQVKRYFEADDKQCCCINNGIDINQFFRRDHDKFTFINVARQDANKNQIAIVRCFEKLYAQDQNIRLMLIGDGPSHDMLVSEVKQRNLVGVIYLPGAMSNVADLYSVSDVYVQSSYREAMPMSVLEALATGLPIISTDVGGLKDVVNGNGWLIPVGAESELYSSMKKAKELSQMEINQMIDKSIEFSRKYSSENMAKEYLNLYGKVAQINQ